MCPKNHAFKIFSVEKIALRKGMSDSFKKNFI